MTHRPIGADDGTGELPAVVETRIQGWITDGDADVQANLDAETDARVAGDATNAANLVTETGNRVAADSLLVPKTTQVNGHALSGNVTVTATDVGLGNVNNTSDANKPVSTAQAAADAVVAAASVAKALVDAKGDILVGTANDTVARKAVGANGSQLVADSAQSDGLRYTTTLMFEGSGDPEGVVTAVVGSTYRDSTNGWLYEKQTGTGNTGWVGVGTPTPRFALPSGTYVIPLTPLGPSTLLGANQSMRFSPWFCPQTLSITRMGAEVSTIGEAGSKVRLGIYADNGSGVPGTLVLDAGQINGDSATSQEIVLGSTLVLSRGWYWLGGGVQSAPTTQPTVRATAGPGPTAPGYLLAVSTSLPAAASQAGGYFQNSVSGALPNPMVPGATGISNSVRVFFKLA